MGRTPASARAGLALATICFLALSLAPAAEAGLSLEQLIGLRRVNAAAISPDGSHVAYLLRVPRPVGDGNDGAPWVELHVAGREGGTRAFVHGEVNVSSARFTPDGRAVTFLAKRSGDEHTSLYAIPVDGGEARRLLAFEDSILAYELFPGGKRAVFIAREPEKEARKTAKENGFTQEVFEEDWRQRKAWIADLEPMVADPTNPADAKADDDEDGDDDGPRALPVDGAVYQIDLSRDGKRLALGVAPRPLVDDRYMFQRVRVVDPETGKELGRLENAGKLGTISLSPDGARVAFLGGEDMNDPDDGRLFVGPAAGGAVKNVLPDLEGSITGMAWQDATTVMVVAAKGVETTFGEVDVESGAVKTHLEGVPAVDAKGYIGGAVDRDAAPVLTSVSLSSDGRYAAFVAHHAEHPQEVYVMSHGEPGLRRLTDSNPWLADVELADQEVIVHGTDDGLELQGILLRPQGAPAGKPAPLILMVHGGPEGHDTNGWVSYYSRPGQVAAARGFAVFYPNYRGSTARGVAFSRLGQGDAAGAEFDDLVEAVDDLVAAGIADPERVGITGGSYGGYATAWCSTRYTERFRAGVMFVGVSDHVSKSFTTDIPEENFYSHTLYRPWTGWQHGLERSPVYHAPKSRTPLLIAGGTSDTRVHPSQSLQLYRALKGIGRTPVRYVRYPGEGHGNSKMAARYDYGRRLLRWLEHYLTGPGGDPPPWSLDSEEEETEDSGEA